jgi:hypothetical protein
MAVLENQRWELFAQGLAGPTAAMRAFVKEHDQ